MRFVLLHSPLLGPLTWQGTAEALTTRGFAAEAPAWTPLVDLDDDFYGSLAKAMARTVEQQGDAPVVLVPHSGAGALAPALIQALSLPVVGVILVDAILPHPGRSWLDTAPPALRQDLVQGAQLGELPSWDGWWPPGALERLVPDPGQRSALLAELQPLPLAYFEEAAPAAELARPAAYLQLSGAYDDQAQAARLRGWPCRRAQLNHLSPLTAPIELAGLIQALGRELAASDG